MANVVWPATAPSSATAIFVVPDEGRRLGSGAMIVPLLCRSAGRTIKCDGEPRQDQCVKRIATTQNCVIRIEESGPTDYGTTKSWLRDRSLRDDETVVPTEGQ